LTGLFLLSSYLTEDNASVLLGEARGKSRRQLEELIAARFPRPDVAPSVALLAVPGDATCSGAGPAAGRARLEPLSAERIRVEFTARAEVYDKLQQARRLLSHALPSAGLGELFERALDALLEKEERKRFGAGRLASRVGSNQALVMSRSRSSAQFGSGMARSARSSTRRVAAVVSGAP
jgi:hypothetical protein